MNLSNPHSNKKISILLVGAGNLAWNFCHAWKNSNFIELYLWNRNPENSIALSNIVSGKIINSFFEDGNSPDFIFLCTKDEAIPELTNKFSGTKSTLVHCSGSIHMNVLEEFSKHAAVFYPLQTFSKGINTNWNEIPVLIESNNQYTCDLLFNLAEDMGAKPILCDSLQRLNLHLAAVFASNFTNHLWSIAYQLCEKHGVAFSLLHPLIKQTINKVISHNQNPALFQTGPAIRNDVNIMNRHLEMLQHDQEIHQLYSLLSRHIIEKKKHEKL